MCTFFSPENSSYLHSCHENVKWSVRNEKLQSQLANYNLTARASRRSSNYGHQIPYRQALLLCFRPISMGRRNRKRKLNYFIDEFLLSFFGTSPDSSKLAFTNEAEWETRRTDTCTISYHSNQDAKKQTNKVKLIPLRRTVNSYAIINE